MPATELPGTNTSRYTGAKTQTYTCHTLAMHTQHISPHSNPTAPSLLLYNTHTTRNASIHDPFPLHTPWMSDKADPALLLLAHAPAAAALTLLPCCLSRSWARARKALTLGCSGCCSRCTFLLLLQCKRRHAVCHEAGCSIGEPPAAPAALTLPHVFTVQQQQHLSAASAPVQPCCLSQSWVQRM